MSDNSPVDDASSPQKRPNMEIQVDDVTAQGVYSNGLMINFNENEFTMDFLYVQPLHPKARVRSRVIMTPNQARRMLKMLGDNMRRFDEQVQKHNQCPHTPPVPVH